MRLSLVLALLLLVLASCAPAAQTVDPQSCTVDTDCTCGGVRKDTGDCFVGNKDWAAQNVDLSKQCPDFCTGIAGNLETKCVSGTCSVVPRQTAQNQGTGNCQTDEDCVATGCSGQRCVPASQAEKSPVFTTCEYRPEYDCLKQTSCGCIEGKCAWAQTAGYKECLAALDQK